MPDSPVSPVQQGLCVDKIAIAQQHRIALVFGLHRHREHRHHVWPIKIIGDFAKALGLALGAKQRARAVQPGQGGIQLGLNTCAACDNALIGHHVNQQRIFADPVFRWLKLNAINRHRQQFHVLAVQFQRRILRHRSIAEQVKARGDDRVVLLQVEMQFRAANQVSGTLIVFEIDRYRIGVSHNATQSFAGTRYNHRICAY